MSRFASALARRSFLHRLRLELLEERWVPALVVPAYSSLPGASATIYLDFDGHFEATWGSYSNITSPAYDTDGNASSYSATELANIEKIWRYVAEDYAPFQINVTTVAPASFANGVGLRVVIGGGSSWTGSTYGGIAYVNSFTSGSVNTVYVFPAHLGNGNPKYVGDAASHEAGHAFGLRHQSAYNGTTMTAQYQQGPGDGTAPLMGNSYSASRGMWWYGATNASSTTYQNDVAIISSSTNGFGYRADDHGNNSGAATQLTATTAGAVSRQGLVGQVSDADWFKFTTGAGTIGLTADVLDPYNNLDARLDLYDSAGNLIASANPTSSFDAALSLTVAAGTYYASVTSSGASSAATTSNYGVNVGQYTLTGSIVYVATEAPTAPATPTGLAATAASTTAIDLAWNDNAGNEAGYKVERLSGGVWTQIGTVGANAKTYRDSGLTAGTSYSYRVKAYNDGGDSANSNQATTSTQSATTIATKPAAASNLRASNQSSPLGVVLNWTDNSNNESGFYVQRSAGRGRWSQIASLGGNVTTYTDTQVSLGGNYEYRIVAHNSVGSAKASNAVSITVVAGGAAAGSTAGGAGSEQPTWFNGRTAQANRLAPRAWSPSAGLSFLFLSQHHHHEDDDNHAEGNTNIAPTVYAGHDNYFASLAS